MRPAFLLVADSGEGAELASRAIEAAGAGISEMVPAETFVEWIDGKLAPAFLWIELSRDHGAGAESLLAWAEEAAGQRAAVIAAMPPELIDVVDARLGGTTATLLVLPDEADRISALSIAINGAANSGFSDIKNDRDLERLRRLAEDLNRVARSLSRASSESAPLAGYAAPKSEFLAEPAAAAMPPLPGADDVRKIIRMRRLRESFVDRALLADPGWDILLDLFAARIDGDDVAVSSLCIAASVAPTTALRWVKMMTEDGLLERRADPGDARRVYISLSDQATRAMADYFQALRKYEAVVI